MQFPIEAILFAFLLAMAFVIARLRNLFAAAMLTGVFSFLSAGMFTLMDAVDVAFTEASVGAGISSVLLLATIAQTTSEEERKPTLQKLPFLVVVLTGAFLAYATLDMPAYGDPGAPIHHHVAPRYIHQSGEEIGIPNIVTSVLASYRGFDTLGELAVIFTAGVGVLLLLESSRRPPFIEAGNVDQAAPSMIRRARMRDKPVLRVVTKAVIPFVLLFALYVQAHGDYGPGGGFQAGVILAAGFILYGLIFGPSALRNVVTPGLVERGVAAGLLLFGGVGIVALALGHNFLDYSALSPDHPQHGQHMGILLVELGVGITVASVMLTIYYHFAGREQP